jgi:hypothetical protein
MKLMKSTFRAALTLLPVGVTVFYGLLVSSPAGEASRDHHLLVRPDARVELAALLARAAGENGIDWPESEDALSEAPEVAAQARSAAATRVRGWMNQGFTSEMLVRLLLTRGTWPELQDVGNGVPDLNGPGTRIDTRELGLTSASLDSFVLEVKVFAASVDFDRLWTAARPRLEKRTKEIEGDPTLFNLTARLTEFFGEPTMSQPVIVPTWFGPWRDPFAAADPAKQEIRVVDRAAALGRSAGQTSLSWMCVKEFARPTVERIARRHAARTRELSGYWNYFRQGVAATSTTGWEDCLNAHLFRAIDLRVRQQNAAQRELGISSALEAGLGMIRVVDAAMTRFDRSRGFYRKFTDYYPTLLESLVGLEARVRIERPLLGVKVTATAAGLRIDEIWKEHSAAGSDLKLGDVILSADLVRVASEEALAGAVESHVIGDTLELLVERGGEQVTIPVVLSRGRTEYEFFRPATPDLQVPDPAGTASG